MNMSIQQLHNYYLKEYMKAWNVYSALKMNFVDLQSLWRAEQYMNMNHALVKLWEDILRTREYNSYDLD